MNIIFLPFFIIWFLLSLLVAFYIPGIIVTKSDKLEGVARHVIAIIVGMVLWTWQGYVFGYLGIRWASYVYLCFFVYLFLKNKKSHLSTIKKITIQKKDILLGILIVVGVIAQTIYYWKFGFLSSQGISHVAYNIHDHYWHASMIREMIDRFPPYEPGMVGILKTNYHYWFNLVTAELIRVFYLPPLVTQALGMYTFGSVMLGLLLYVLGMSLYASRLFVFWLIFFFYFASDLSTWFVFYSQKIWDFQVPSLIEDGSNFMDNPPRAFSVIVGLAALYIFFRYLDRKYKNILILALLFGSLVGFKVYTAIGLLSGLGAISIYHLFLKRRATTIVIFILAVIFSALIFFPVNGNSGGVFFLPFEKVRDFITYKPLGFFDMEMRWRVFQEYQNFPRILHLGILMTIIYFIVQFGFKLLGIIPYKKTLTLLGKEKILFCLVIIFISIITGSFISLKANPAESYNFYLPGILILSLLAALNLTLFLQNKARLFIILTALIIIIVGSPRWFYRALVVAPKAISQFSGISYDELASYEFLKENTPNNTSVLVMNRGEKDSLSAIAKVYSGKDMYLSGQAISVAHNTTNKKRITVVNAIYESSNSKDVVNILNSQAISYLYFYGIPHLPYSPNEVGSIVFQNGSATIIKVNSK